MIRLRDIQASLHGLIGFRTESEEVSDHLRRSESGLFYEDEHPLLTLANIQGIAPRDWKPKVKAWKEGTLYDPYDTVEYMGSNYVTNVATNRMPIPENAEWVKITDTDLYLLQKVQRSIARLIVRFMDEKKSELETKSLLETKYLFNQAGRIADIVKKSGRIVGLELTTPRYRHVSTKINKIGLQTKGTGSIDVYLFHSSNPQPIDKATLNRTSNGAMQWFDVDWILPYVNTDQDSGGVWYVCYWEEDLGDMQAIKKDYDFGKKPCSSCNAIDVTNYEAWSRYLGINPFYTQGGADRDLWDIGTNMYTSNNNYGLNLQVSVGCDLTDFIIEQRSMFANALSKQFAIDVLSDLYYNGNGRINYTSQNGNFDKIVFDLNGDGLTRKTGIKYALEKAIDALKIDVRGLDAVCLPCRKRGLRTTVI